MTIALVIVAAWLLLVGGMVVALWLRAEPLHTPKPVPTKEQLVWMIAAAKVAARRHA